MYFQAYIIFKNVFVKGIYTLNASKCARELNTVLLYESVDNRLECGCLDDYLQEIKQLGYGDCSNTETLDANLSKNLENTDLNLFY